MCTGPVASAADRAGSGVIGAGAGSAGGASSDASGPVGVPWSTISVDGVGAKGAGASTGVGVGVDAGAMAAAAWSGAGVGVFAGPDATCGPDAVCGMVATWAGAVGALDVLLSPWLASGMAPSATVELSALL